MRRDLWIKLPPEDPMSGAPGVCGKLLKSLYGTRDAGQNFELLVSEFMKSKDFIPGLFSPCTFRHEAKHMLSYVYGDNFVVKGGRNDLRWFLSELQKTMIANVEGVLGPDPSQGDQLEVTCLNRIFRWVRGVGGTPDSIEIEADPRHVEIIVHQLNLIKGKSVGTPGVKRAPCEDAKTLSPQEATRFRSLAMRAAYLAEDRPELKFATKELARDLQNPTTDSWDAVKRLGRYLVGRPRLVQRFPRQPPQSVVVAFSDSDHAGCARTRKSTTGVALFHGSHMLKFSSHTQTVVSTSTGEAEWYACVKAASALIGLRSLGADLGRKFSMLMRVDATAAQGIAARRGVGQVKHLAVSTLWLQQWTTSKELKIKKVDSGENVADLGTKHLEAKILQHLLKLLGFHVQEGRVEAPKAYLE